MALDQKLKDRRIFSRTGAVLKTSKFHKFKFWNVVDDTVPLTVMAWTVFIVIRISASLGFRSQIDAILLFGIAASIIPSVRNQLIRSLYIDSSVLNINYVHFK